MCAQLRADFAVAFSGNRGTSFAVLTILLAKVYKFKPVADQTKFGEFGKILKSLRESRRFTQVHVAHSVGLDNTYLSRIENGSAPAPEIFPTVFRIAKALELEFGAAEFKQLIIAALHERKGLPVKGLETCAVISADQIEILAHAEIQMFTEETQFLFSGHAGGGDPESPEASAQMDRPLSCDHIFPKKWSRVENAFDAVSQAMRVIQKDGSVFALELLRKNGEREQIIFPPACDQKQSWPRDRVSYMAGHIAEDLDDKVGQALEQFKTGNLTQQEALAIVDSAWDELQRVCRALGKVGLDAIRCRDPHNRMGIWFKVRAEIEACDAGGATKREGGKSPDETV
jgi:transcriptional regulator with XRE-family HTH domain